MSSLLEKLRNATRGLYALYQEDLEKFENLSRSMTPQQRERARKRLERFATEITQLYNGINQISNASLSGSRGMAHITKNYDTTVPMPHSYRQVYDKEALRAESIQKANRNE